MMQDVEQMLEKNDIKADHIFKEAFGADLMAKQTENLPKGPFRITFSRSHKILQWQSSHGSLLDLAEKSGIFLNSGCRAGQCESCSVALLEGKVWHPEAEDETNDFCLTCCAHPLSDLVLDA